MHNKVEIIVPITSDNFYLTIANIVLIIRYIKSKSERKNGQTKYHNYTVMSPKVIYSFMILDAYILNQ